MAQAQAPSATRPPVKPSRIERRDDYLSAAERLFIRLGYEGASMRLIAAEADTHTGVLTYHWDRKETLFREIFERRLGPIHRDQAQRLEACDGLELRPIVAALIEPTLIDATGRPRDQTSRLLFGRALLEPSEVVMRIMAELFSQVTPMFHGLMRRALADQEAERFHWGYVCALGVSVFPQSFGDRVTLVTGYPRAEPDWRAISKIVVDFIVGGLNALGDVEGPRTILSG